MPPVDLSRTRRPVPPDGRGLRAQPRRRQNRVYRRDLTVRGERPGQACCPERYQQLERGQGQFSRSFRFGLPVDADAITADLTDGVLTVIVPKAVRRGDARSRSDSQSCHFESCCSLPAALIAGFAGGLVVSGRMSLTSPSTATPASEQAAAGVGSRRAATPSARAAGPDGGRRAGHPGVGQHLVDADGAGRPVRSSCSTAPIRCGRRPASARA